MHSFIQGSSDWLELRKTKITATDSGVILGLSPFKTPFALWRQKMDLDPPEIETPAMARGTLLEPIAREWLEKKRGIKCEPIVIIKDFMMSSLDGLTRDKKTVVEIKCGSKSFAQAERGEIAPYYLSQLYHQMHCADVDQSLFVAFNGEHGIVIPVERDQDFINNMIEKEREFYECLITFTSPMMTTRDYLTRSDSQWISLSEKYRIAHQNLKNAEELEQNLKQELIALSQSKSTMGNGIKLSKVVKKGLIDYSAIQEIKNVDLEKYRKKPIEYFRVSID
jgi:putative phage-type endonuclease